MRAQLALTVVRDLAISSWPSGATVAYSFRWNVFLHRTSAGDSLFNAGPGLDIDVLNDVPLGLLLFRFTLGSHTSRTLSFTSSSGQSDFISPEFMINIASTVCYLNILRQAQGLAVYL